MKIAQTEAVPVPDRLRFLKVLVHGLASYAAPVSALLPNHTGGTDSTRYCYSVWLRHMVVARYSGVRSRLTTVAELGPGDSLGVGLAALICGANTYYGLDVYKYASPEGMAEMFDELLELFQRREQIPDQDEFPTLAPLLDSYAFPSFLFDDGGREAFLDTGRIRRLRRLLHDLSEPDCPIRYIIPWCRASISAGSIDMLLSQAVLERISGLRSAYSTMYLWLKPGGFMSHQIDFGDPRTTGRWNGNWCHSDFVWNCLRGKRASWGNREAHSAHIQSLTAAGFDIACDLKQRDFSGVQRDQLAPRFRNLPDDDLTIRGAFILARKPAV